MLSSGFILIAVLSYHIINKTTSLKSLMKLLKFSLAYKYMKKIQKNNIKIMEEGKCCILSSLLVC